MIFGTGNPDPIKDGRSRPGDNLYTDCTVALDADTGKLAWYFQATPHDDHDYDNNQTMSLATIRVNGADRKVVTWTSRNGFFYTVDRTTGENIVTSKLFPNVNWAQDRIRSTGTPERNENKAGSRGGSLGLAGFRRGGELSVAKLQPADRLALHERGQQLQSVLLER